MGSLYEKIFISQGRLSEGSRREGIGETRGIV